MFTLLAILFIDRFGRKFLLMVGLSGIAISMFVLAWGFHMATYTLTSESAENLPEHIDRTALAPIVDQTFDSDLAFKQAISVAFGPEEARKIEPDLIARATSMNSWLVLMGIIAL